MNLSPVRNGGRGRRSPRDPARHPKADHPLSDAEIEERFGDLMVEALHYFRTDPGYVTGMAENATKQAAKTKPIPKP